MAGATQNYGLAFFDFGDRLDSQVNVQLEVNRFTLIDKQLYGLFSVFGNGVISGWDVIITTDLKVTINPGIGIIESLAVETSFPEDVIDLPANDSFSIYAIVEGDTATNRNVTFQYSRTILGDNAILLANITTGATGVITADTTVRTLINFESIIDYEVKHHRHTGSPPKIQLDLETKGLLPGSNLANQDASIITSGKFTADRIAQIDHSQLKNIGFLTHAQLDSLISSLQRDNEQLLGETSTVNLMRYIIAEKYKDSTVDETFVNELALIPGISPDGFTDFVNTTANYDLNTMCISGVPSQFLDPNPLGGGTPQDLEVVTITWNTDTEFKAAPVISNLNISNGVRLMSDTVEDVVIEDFEVIQSGQAAGFNGSLSETTDINAFYDTSIAAQGFNSGRFDIQHTYHAIFQKTYSTSLDWTNFNELIVYVRSSSASHAAVYMQIKDTTGALLTTYNLLAVDEITTGANTGGFAEKVFDITTLPTRNNIGSIVIFTSNIQQQEEIFYLDNIFVRNTALLLPQGTLRLRYSSATNVIFRSVEYEATVPTGTDFRVRIRTGEDVNSLIRAPFGTRLSSGDVFSAVGSEIEIEITFFSDLDRTLTPELTWFQLQLLVESDSAGFTVKDATAWSAGTLENIQVKTASSDSISLNYTNVGNMYFLYENTVNEIDPTRIPQFGVNGGKVPLSPIQAFQAINGAPSRGFTNPRSVYRMITGDYLVADTDNDRVIQVKPDGTFVRGYGSHNRNYDTVNYSLSAVYNPRLGKLFIMYSTDQALVLYDLTTVHVSWGQNVITLDNNSDHIHTLDTDTAVAFDPNATSSVTDRIISILLSQDHQNQLANITDPLFAQIDTDPDLNFLECFYGDFMYYGRGAIVRPVYANKLDDTSWTIANSHIFQGYDDLAATTDGKAAITDLVSKTVSIITVEEDTGLITINSSLNIFDFTFNGIDFADVTLGGIFPLDDRRILIAGLRKIPTNSSSSSSSASSVTGAPQTISDSDRVQGYQGYVIMLDKTTQTILFKYESPEGLFPSDVIIDEDGLFVVAETSFIPQAGRIVKLDRTGNILSVISGGMYSRIHDIRNLPSGHLLIST